MSDSTHPTQLKGLASVWPEDDQQAPQTVYFKPPRKKSYNARWLLLWQDETGAGIVEQAKMEKPLTQVEYRVRDFILGTIGIGNYCYVNQAEVGRELRIARQDVSKAIKRLIALQILIPGPKSGRSNTYMVNPSFCFSGGIKAGIRARSQAKESGKVIPFKSISSDA